MKCRRGFHLVDLAAVTAAAVVLAAITVPSLAGVRRSSGTDGSTSNLITLAITHAVYAADWNGRQFTAVDDAISSFGDEPSAAFTAWTDECERTSPPGTYCQHPTGILGWGETAAGNTTFFGYAPNYAPNHSLVVPLTFTSPPNWVGLGLGSFRIPNYRGLHDYIGGRFYDPVFYAPNDVVALDAVTPTFESPLEFPDVAPPVPGQGDLPYWTSYVLSPAAMFHPDVMRNPIDGGWQDPWLIDHGFQCPGQYDATYPDLKTQMIEHHWLQNAPKDPCNPNFKSSVFAGCEPWYFNHGLASTPLALFYDGSIRFLPNADVLDDDALLMRDSGFGLWSRDTPFGSAGYFGDQGFDLFSLSHHVLTTDGIHGRDTLAGIRPLASSSAGSRRRALGDRAHGKPVAATTEGSRLRFRP